MNTATLALHPRFTPAPNPDVASDAFVNAMRGAATGVNIVTTDGPDGRFGLTVSAFSSVSAEPPRVLVCINRRSPACAAVLGNRRFCVNVLSATQRSIADTFAGRSAAGEAYTFDAGSWRSPVAGSPVLNDAVASFDCTVESSTDTGTHTIFVGAVHAVESNGTSPLIYTDGAYRQAGIKV